ncbi:peptidoglycan DD-metalloendopeptidase family protein [Agromyces soli]
MAGTTFAVAPAQAATYPSWDELQAAKANTAAAAAAVEQITSLIAQLEQNVETTRAEAELRMTEYLDAQQRYDDAARKAAELQALAQQTATEAATAKQNAGQVAAQLYRSGGGDLSVDLFLESGDDVATDALLSKLGNMEKMVERTSEVYRSAQAKTNNAQSLEDQAAVAEAEREKLRIAAEQALAAAQEAQAAAEAALAESQAKKIELDQQLAFMKDAEAKTTAAYEEGERIKREEEERRRQEALRTGAPGAVASSGWARPAAGYISDGFGPRPVICGGGYCSSGYHYAYDIATGCWAPIYAANSGIVTIAGWSGSYGNYVKINHGGGISTGYAHISEGGILVGSGQWVDAGQQIAWSGTTGASTGCHLHFEVWDGGTRINPGPFMADRGVGLG